MLKIARRQSLLIYAALLVVIMRGFVPPGFMPSAGPVPFMVCPDGMVMPHHDGTNHSSVEHCPFGGGCVFAPLTPASSLTCVARLEFLDLIVPEPPSAVTSLEQRPHARGPPPLA
jgi:hypothetical protein